MQNTYPILEFDPAPRAILNPDIIQRREDIPTHAVVCFFQDVINDLLHEEKLEHFADLRSEMGNHPLYLYKTAERTLLLFHPGVGAPLAVGLLEEVIALGAQKFIACGGCGVLDDHVDVGHPFILTSAVRDEGTSYHYLAPGREALPHPDSVAALKTTLNEHKLVYNLAKTWTTDAIYRETIEKRNLRVAQGCEVVEMEAAAFFAVAEFRQVVFGQILYGGDLVKPEGWDGRQWNSRASARRLLFDLAVEAVLRLP
jgi:uridine phosphorylase